uniref:Sulfotransferase n=1 Tax=Latimeria chalumnae TaxID=7897 RepID=H3AP53_LATCH
FSMEVDYTNYKGYFFPLLSHTHESLSYAENEFQVRDGDTFNITYPKSGSTSWMLEILSLIHTKGDPSWSYSVPNWDRIPWIETKNARKQLEHRPDPRFISSHLPVDIFPKSLFGTKAKVVYTARNPKDVFVSLFYFHHMASFLQNPGTVEGFMDTFLKGEVTYGSWFDHIKGWLAVKDKLDFFFITYEEL